MKYIEKLLMKEQDELEKYAAKVKERLKNVPRGRVRICKKGNRLEYYLKEEAKKTDTMDESLDSIKSSKKKGNKNGRYIRKKDEMLVKKIVQRDYDTKLLEKVEEKIGAIDEFLKKYKEADIVKVYENTNQYRRALLDDAMISDEEYVTNWECVDYEGKGFAEGDVEIYTDRGERVRSKSEKIIADRLNVLGIPYRYECPLLLNGSTKVYPDFTLLNIATREEVYLEHCGLMDYPAYVEILMYKLKSYERNGIYLGLNLFITYESSKYPLNAKIIDVLVENLFCCTRANVLLQ